MVFKNKSPNTHKTPQKLVKKSQSSTNKMILFGEFCTVVIINIEVFRVGPCLNMYIVYINFARTTKANYTIVNSLLYLRLFTQRIRFKIKLNKG